MTYTASDGIEVPYNIGFYRYVSGSIALAEPMQTIVPTGVGQPAVGIGWYGGNAIYQVQWCYMRRLTPERAIAVDPSGNDVWYGWDGDLVNGTRGQRGAWGDWQGVDLNDEVRSDTTPPAYQGTAGLYAVDSAQGAYDPYQVPLPTLAPSETGYDLARMKVRVRALWSWYTPKRVSQWAEKELTLAPVPSMGWNAYRNADGSVSISLDTTLLRGGNLFEISVDGYPTQSSVEGPDPYVTFENWNGGSTVSIVGSFTTVDGLRLPFSMRSLEVTDPTPSAPVPEPTVEVTPDGAVAVTPPSGTSYNTVYAHVTYTDEEGNVYDEQIDMSRNGGSWVGEAGTPPLDVPVDVVVSYTVGNDWGYVTHQAVIESGGLVMFDWPDSVGLRIRYNPDRQLTVTLKGDTVDIAGSTLPKSRHGLGRSSDMTMQGTLINPAEDSYNGDGWLAQLEVLNEPHDWIFRTPNGLRRRVRVESYTPAWATQSANRIMDVTINMQEVAG